MSFSDTLTAVYCNPQISPSISLHSTDELILSNYPALSSIEWFLDDELIQDQQNDTITALTNGTYSAQITDQYGCIYSTSNFQLSVSLSEYTTGQWMIYPNPTKDVLTIEVEEK